MENALLLIQWIASIAADRALRDGVWPGSLWRSNELLGALVEVFVKKMRGLGGAHRFIILAPLRSACSVGSGGERIFGPE